MSQTTAQTFLRIAVELIGADEVAVRLKSPRPLVDAWLRGHATMPERKMLDVVDLLDALKTVKKGGRPERP